MRPHFMITQQLMYSLSSYYKQLYLSQQKKEISVKPAIVNLQGNGIPKRDLKAQGLLMGKFGVSREIIIPTI